MLQSIFNSRLSIHLIIRHSIYPVGIITRYKLCATTDSQKVELTMKTPLITREGYEKLKQEMDYLWRQERPEVTKKVTWAASLGGLPVQQKAPAGDRSPGPLSDQMSGTVENRRLLAATGR